MGYWSCAGAATWVPRLKEKSDPRFSPQDRCDSFKPAPACDLPARRLVSDAARCSSCDAVCCRLTVVLQPEDNVPPHLTTHLANGMRVMQRDEEGWCVALNGNRMNCGIYESRPGECRRFVMGGPYCKSVRAEYRERFER